MFEVQQVFCHQDPLLRIGSWLLGGNNECYVVWVMPDDRKKFIIDKLTDQLDRRPLTIFVGAWIVEFGI